jgi:hypothetical protein
MTYKDTRIGRIGKNTFGCHVFLNKDYDYSQPQGSATSHDKKRKNNNKP